MTKYPECPVCNPPEPSEDDLQAELGRILRKVHKLEKRKEEILDELEPGPAGDRS